MSSILREGKSINLGVIPSSSPPLTPHIQSISKSCQFYLNKTSRIWPHLSTSTAGTLAHVLISSHQIASYLVSLLLPLSSTVYSSQSIQGDPIKTKSDHVTYRQNNSPTPKDVHALIPGTYKYAS